VEQCKENASSTQRTLNNYEDQLPAPNALVNC